MMKRLVLTMASVLATIGLAGLVGADEPSPTIKEAIPTRSGDYLLVRRGDGRISLLQAT